MSELHDEIERIRGTEIVLGAPYDLDGKPPGSLRVVFMFPYAHEFSLLCMGPLALYDLINRSPEVPAFAERALMYESLRFEGGRAHVPEGDVYRSIESDAPVSDAHIVGLSITNGGDLPAFFRMLDVAGIPRRRLNRTSHHPLIVGGNGGFANPEVLADYLDVVAVGEGEESFLALIAAVDAANKADTARVDLLQELARIPGLYVPAMYVCDLVSTGGVVDVRPRTPLVPGKVHPQFLSVDSLHTAHFISPISDGGRAMIVPTLGCRWECHFCNLGVPPFRQAPFDLLESYLELLEKHGIRQVIVSSPTFTQYGKRYALLDRLKSYSERSGGKVTTIIGSVRADELSARYLDAVTELGDFGHLFAELALDNARGIITIAPEFANPDLVKIYNKTMTPQRVKKAISLCRDNENIANIMLYFIVGAPGEEEADRLAIADYAAQVFEDLGRENGAVIVKLQQFMPTPNTVSQRLEMLDPTVVEGFIEGVRQRLRDLVGQASYDRNFRVIWGETSRLLLESVCMRGDRRIGEVLEELYDSGTDFRKLTDAEFQEALSAHGLEHQRYLRRFDIDETLPWEVINTVDKVAEAKLMADIDARGAVTSRTGTP
ncbi:radical SAM protein [Longispora sp. K20-0274]|uniref:B12-binding domain-containing radical SAM protein n=1 Tax=Longispora sp. K20-0274 TaxID=3088255 RepID=UPI00399B5ABE